MKVCASTCIILFPYQRMCSRASYVELWKYVLACIICFLIAVKGIHINMQTGVCQRFSCQNGGSGASQFIFDCIAVTYIVCSFSLHINNILWFMAVRHKSYSLIVRLGCLLSLMAHTPRLLAFE
jgi:hypothetical protein